MTAGSATDWGPFSLAGRRAAVTGAARGIGLAIARRYLEAGASVLLTDHRAESVAAAVARLRAASLGGAGARLRGAVVDVSAASAGDDLVAAAVAAFGGLDVLVNNAGVYPYQPMLDADRGAFERVLAVNLTGAAFCAQAAACRMIAQGRGGAIVNVASTNAECPPMVGLAAYDASKAGLVALALELAPHRVRVNAIAPGAIATPGSARFVEEFRARPARRRGAPSVGGGAHPPRTVRHARRRGDRRRVPRLGRRQLHDRGAGGRRRRDAHRVTHVAAARGLADDARDAMIWASVVL